MKNNMSAMTGSSLGLSFDLPDLNAGGGEGAGAPAGGAGEGAGAGNAGGASGGEGGSGQPGGGSAAPAGGGASGAAGAGAGGQPPKAEDLFDIVVGGKTEKVTRAELVARAQQGTDYTKKTQELAEQRRRWEADRQTVLQAEREKWQRENTEAAERRRQESETDPGARALSHSQRLEQRLEDQALDITLGKLLPKFEGISEGEFLKEAMARGLASADQVAKHGEQILSEMVKSREEGFNSRFEATLQKGEHPGLKAFIEAQIQLYLKNKTSGPTPPNSGNSSTPSLGDPKRRAKSFDEAADMAQEMLDNAART